jgi:parallel beta-helix repeat protein
MSTIVLFALMFGNFYSVSAASVSAALVTTVKSYIADKNNIGENGCNDAWPGTLSQPFCTINKGIAVLQSGDTLYVRRGTYPAFSVNKSNITISGYNGELPIINEGIGIRLYNASYVTVHGFEVVGAAGNWSGGITLDGGGYNIIDGNKAHDNTYAGMSGIQIYNSSFNKVTNNEAYNNYESGITISGNSSDNDVGFNKAYNNVLSGGNSDGMGSSYPSTRTNFHDNLIYGNADDGIDTWNSQGNFIIHNIAYNHNGVGDGNGFKLGGGATGGHNLIKQNISYNNKARGFTSNQSGGNTYYNNVAYNNNYGFEDGMTPPSMAQNIFINNIGYNNVIANFSVSKYATVSHNNIWYSDGGAPKVLYNYNAYATLSAFFLASGLDNPHGDLASLQVDPQFVNPVEGLFDLLPSSPAIDHGDPDNPGQIQAINRVDIGAFEVTLIPGTLYSSYLPVIIYRTP